MEIFHSINWYDNWFAITQQFVEGVCFLPFNVQHKCIYRVDRVHIYIRIIAFIVANKGGQKKLLNISVTVVQI